MYMIRRGSNSSNEIPRFVFDFVFTLSSKFGEVPFALPVLIDVHRLF